MVQCPSVALAALLLAIPFGACACSGDDTNTPPGGADATSDGTLPAGDASLDAAAEGATDSPSPEGATDGGPGTSDAGAGADADAAASADGGDGAAGPHSPCAPGIPLDPASDPCTANLCGSGGEDSYCCTTSWDLSCAATARVLCATECTTDLIPADGGIGALGGTSHAIAQIASRDDAACAVSVEGDLWCWGRQNILGDGSEQAAAFPRKILGLPATQSVAMAGDAICALGVDHGVRCWGHYPAGSPNGVNVITPPSAPILANATAIAGDRLLGGTDSFLCAVVAGSALCWGTAGSTLGPGVANPTVTPSAVDLTGAAAGSTAVTSIFAGAGDTCVLVGDGGAPLCWGNNASGMLGHDGFDDGGAPSVAALACIPASDAEGGADDCANALSGVTKIAIGASSLCLLDANHAVRCLGDNSAGQLGSGVAGGAFPYPQVVAGLTAADIAVGGRHACAAPLDAAAPVVCWGSNAEDELGPGALDAGLSSSPSPVAVVGLSHVVALTAWNRGTCALDATGAVWCWGEGDVGELATGSAGVPVATPVRVPFVSFP